MKSTAGSRIRQPEGLIGPRLLRGIHDDLQLLDDLTSSKLGRAASPLGRLVSTARVARTRSRETARAAQINHLFTTHDVLVTPVIGAATRMADTWPNAASSAISWRARRGSHTPSRGNFTGQPAMSILSASPIRTPVAVRS